MDRRGTEASGGSCTEVHLRQELHTGSELVVEGITKVRIILITKSGIGQKPLGNIGFELSIAGKDIAFFTKGRFLLEAREYLSSSGKEIAKEIGYLL